MSEAGEKRVILLWVEKPMDLAARLGNAVGERYRIKICQDHEDACREVDRGAVCAVLADPELRAAGYHDFLRAVHRQAPELPVALIRSVASCQTYNYLRMYGAAGAMETGGAFRARELAAFIDHLAGCRPTDDIDRLFAPDAARGSMRLASPSERERVHERLGEVFGPSAHVDNHDLQLVFEEIVNNAIFHAFRTADNESKYRSQAMPTTFEEDERLEVAWGLDDEQAALSVSDNRGLLSPAVVWDRFFRQTSLRGLLDTNGRGLYLAHLLSRLLLVSVAPGRSTQVTTVFSCRGESSGDRALSLRVYGHGPIDTEAPSA